MSETLFEYKLHVQNQKPIFNFSFLFVSFKLSLNFTLHFINQNDHSQSETISPVNCRSEFNRKKFTSKKKPNSFNVHQMQ